EPILFDPNMVVRDYSMKGEPLPVPANRYIKEASWRRNALVEFPDEEDFDEAVKAWNNCNAEDESSSNKDEVSEDNNDKENDEIKTKEQDADTLDLDNRSQSVVAMSQEDERDDE